MTLTLFQGALMLVLPEIKLTKKHMPKKMFINQDLIDFFTNETRSFLEEEQQYDTILYIPTYDVACLDTTRINAIYFCDYYQEPFKALESSEIKLCSTSESSEDIVRNYDLYCIPYSDDTENPTKLDTNMCQNLKNHLKPNINIVRICANGKGLVKKYNGGSTFSIKAQFTCTPSHFPNKNKSINLFFLFVPVDKSQPVIISVCRCFTSSVYRRCKREAELDADEDLQERKRLKID